MRLLRWAIILLLVVFVNLQAQAPRSAQDHFRRGLAHYTRGNLDAAIAEYNRAIELNPCSSHAFLHHDHAYRAKGDLNEAVANYESAIRIDSRAFLNNRQVAEVFNNRGFIRLNQLNVEGCHLRL